MTIEEIMERDLADAEREAGIIGDDCSLPWVNLLMWLVLGVGVICSAFTAGKYYERFRENKRLDEFRLWLEKTELEAGREARNMTNYEILKTERGCGPSDKATKKGQDND